MVTKRLALALALAVLLASSARAANPVPPAQPAVVMEPHPEINRAIDALQKARWRLEHARHDFGGHRVAAIGAIDRALEQLRLAQRFDRD